MAAYTWLVARAVARADDASCSCFGARKRVTKVTVLRNAWLTAVAALTVSVIWANPLFGGALAGAALLSAWLGSSRSPSRSSRRSSSCGPRGGPRRRSRAPTLRPLRWHRHGTSSTTSARAPCGSGDARRRHVVNLRTLAQETPDPAAGRLDTCGGCKPVIDRLGEWRELLPEVDVRFLLAHLARGEPADPRRTSRSPCTIPTATSAARSRIGVRPRPSCSESTASSPAAGHRLPAIEEFVAEIHESLHPVSVD